MSMAYVRKTYNVPAKRGGRVIYSGNGRDEYGTILSARYGRLYIRLDGKEHADPLPFHPTWKLRYLA